MNMKYIGFFTLFFLSTTNVYAGIKGKELKIFCQAAVEIESKRPISNTDIVKTPYCYGYIMGVEAGFSLASAAVQQNQTTAKNDKLTKMLKTSWMNKNVKHEILAKKIVKIIDDNPKYLTYPAAIIVIRALKSY